MRYYLKIVAVVEGPPNLHRQIEAELASVLSQRFDHGAAASGETSVLKVQIAVETAQPNLPILRNADPQEVITYKRHLAKELTEDERYSLEKPKNRHKSLAVCGLVAKHLITNNPAEVTCRNCLKQMKERNR